MSSNIPPTPSEQICTRSCSNKHTHNKDAGSNKPQLTLDEMAVQLKREKKKIDGLHTQKRNHKFLHATGAAQHQVQNPKTPNRSMWDYLKRYKTDHVQSTLPKEANENASKDPRTGRLALSRPFGLAPVSFCP